jgi:FixJ family two-component response regulator
VSISRSNCAASDLFAPGNLRASASHATWPAASHEKISAKSASAAVAVVDDDERVSQALAFQLETAGFYTAAYASARELLQAKDVCELDCIVADIYLPGMNGLQLQHELNRVAPYTSIVFVTGHGDLSVAMSAVRNGAVDFLEKPVDDETLLFSVGIGADRARMRRREHLVRSQVEEGYDRLSPRECDVFALITQGLLNKQVAAALGITERTVKAHRGHVMNKMNARSLADLVRMAEILRIHDKLAESSS